MAGFNNGYNNNNYQNTGYQNYGNGYAVNNFGNYSANQNGSIGLSVDQIVQYFRQGYLTFGDYVHGRSGADAYPLPPGITMARLWDDENNRFYVKGYDNNGRPRVLDDNDFIKHVEPEPQIASNIDLSNYATKDDIQKIVSDAFAANIASYQQQLQQMGVPDMSNYVTMQQFNQGLDSLSVGNGGRIVRNNESNA